jgi:two-component system nitrogen regulation response regulator GlnG
VAEGRFREDLYFRLNVATLRLPPLRERLDDIPDLACAFLYRASREGLPAKTIDPAALERLQAHDWPGNVRELGNVIRRMCALYAEDGITAWTAERELCDQPASPAEAQSLQRLTSVIEQSLASYFSDVGDDGPPRDLHSRVMTEVERPLIRLALAAVRGNQLRAAEILGLNRNTLRKKIAEFGLPARTRGASSRR